MADAQKLSKGCSDARAAVMQLLRVQCGQEGTGAETVYTDPLTGLCQIKGIPIDIDGFEGYSNSITIYTNSNQ